MTFAATAPLPDGLDEILFAGFIRKKSVRAGQVRNDRPRGARGFGFCARRIRAAGRVARGGAVRRSTGFYTPVDDYPVFHLTAITHRSDADLSRDDRGHPADGGFLYGAGQRAAFSAGLQNEFPGDRGHGAAGGGGFHNLVFVSIRKQYPWQAYKIMHGLWGMGQMMFTKYIVVVDED